MLKWRPACKAVLSGAFGFACDLTRRRRTRGRSPRGKISGAAACKAVPRHQLRHNKVLSFRQFSYGLRPGTVSRVTNASLSIALQAIPSHAILQHIHPLGETSLYFFYDNRDNGDNIYSARECARVVSVVPVVFVVVKKQIGCTV